MFTKYLKSQRFNKKNLYYSERADKYLAKLHVHQNYSSLIKVSDLIYSGVEIDDIKKYSHLGKIVIKPNNSCRRVIIIDFDKNTMKFTTEDIVEIYQQTVLDLIADKEKIGRSKLSTTQKKIVNLMNSTIMNINKELDRIQEEKDGGKEIFSREIQKSSEIILNQELVNNICKKWMEYKWCTGICKTELFYKDIKKRLIVEEYIDIKEELKFHVIHGQVCFIEHIPHEKGRLWGRYNTEGNILDILYHPDNRRSHRNSLKKNPHLANYVSIVEEIVKSENINYVRFDTYVDKNNDLYFGEFTFTPDAFKHNYKPSSFNKFLYDSLISGNVNKSTLEKYKLSPHVKITDEYQPNEPYPGLVKILNKGKKKKSINKTNVLRNNTLGNNPNDNKHKIVKRNLKIKK